MQYIADTGGYNETPYKRVHRPQRLVKITFTLRIQKHE